MSVLVHIYRDEAAGEPDGRENPFDGIETYTAPSESAATELVDRLAPEHPNWKFLIGQARPFGVQAERDAERDVKKFGRVEVALEPVDTGEPDDIITGSPAIVIRDTESGDEVKVNLGDAVSVINGLSEMWLISFYG